jgi:hypothetical protein
MAGEVTARRLSPARWRLVRVVVSDEVAIGSVGVSDGAAIGSVGRL